MEEPDLAEHRPDAAHLEHQPLQRLVAGGGIVAEQLAALLRQVLQNRPRLEQRQRLATGAVGIEDGWDLVVGAEGDELGAQLVIAVEADLVRLVGQADLFEHDRHLDAVGCGQRIQLQALGMLRGPFAGDGECAQIGHGHTLPGKWACHCRDIPRC
ncbi:hypothetical protein D3C79_490730 [compost metagenome]